MAPAPVSNGLPAAQDLGQLSVIPKEIHHIISHIALFGDLEPSEVQALEHFCYVYRVTPGTVVCREGDPSDYLLVVAEGAVSITKRDEHGSEKSLGIADVGKTLGEMSLLDGGPRSATCVATQNTVFVALTRSRYEELAQAYPKVALKILLRLAAALSRRLRNTNQTLVEFLDD